VTLFLESVVTSTWFGFLPFKEQMNILSDVITYVENNRIQPLMDTLLTKKPYSLTLMMKLMCSEFKDYSPLAERDYLFFKACFESVSAADLDILCSRDIESIEN